MAESYPKMVKKHSGKRRNCSLRAISPFSTVFSEDLSCRKVKTKACLGKGLDRVNLKATQLLVSQGFSQSEVCHQNQEYTPSVRIHQPFLKMFFVLFSRFFCI